MSIAREATTQEMSWLNGYLLGDYPIEMQQIPALSPITQQIAGTKETTEQSKEHYKFWTFSSKDSRS